MAGTKKTTAAHKAPTKATTQEASGAIIEPGVAKLPDHPAIDANPRENTTAEQNRADFNDPTKDDAQAVTDNLKAQG